MPAPHSTNMQSPQGCIGHYSSILTFCALGTHRKRAGRQRYLRQLAQVSEQHRHLTFNLLKRLCSWPHWRQIHLVEPHLGLSRLTHQNRTWNLLHNAGSRGILAFAVYAGQWGMEIWQQTWTTPCNYPGEPYNTECCLSNILTLCYY